MQKFHRFDEQRDDEGVIWNRSAKIDTIDLLLYLSASRFSFRFLPLAKIIEQMKNG
jgi:hypothetical protein